MKCRGGNSQSSVCQWSIDPLQEQEVGGRERKRRKVVMRVVTNAFSLLTSHKYEKTGVSPRFNIECSVLQCA